MPPDPENPSFKDHPQAGSVPPLLPATEPPLIGPPPPLPATPPPPRSPKSNRKTVSAEHVLAFLLSLFLGLFLADALVSFADDSLILLFDLHVLSVIRAILALFAMLMALLIYFLMGLTPMVPKRLFLPLALFTPVAVLIAVPALILSHGRVHQIAWATSFAQVILGLSILYYVRDGFKFHWPLVAETKLKTRRFSWRNLTVFLVVNLLVLPPVLAAYFVVCGTLAVDHFSAGFVALRPAGLTVQARKYVRTDGRTIQLVPMIHIGETDFYWKLARSFPTNSIILMEGVTDNRNLLTNKVTYRRMAKSLGVTEQQKEFKPQGLLVPADVDVEEFATNTIGFLNLIMLIHAKGMDADTLLKIMQFSSPDFEQQLFDDLLRLRNRRVLEEIQDRLPQAEHLVVPWGAAHMPEIAREIQKLGFRVDETQEYVAIRFRSISHKNEDARKGGPAEKPK